MTPAPVEQSLPGALLFSFLTFAWEQTVCIPEPKPTQIIICVMYDLLSLEGKSSDDLECLANTVVAILVLPVKPLVGSVPENKG